MPKVMQMAPRRFRRPDFEVGRAFRGASPVGAVFPHKDAANETVITLGTRNDGSVQAVKDLPIFQPSLDRELEGSRIIYVVDRILFRHPNVNVIPRGYPYPDSDVGQ